MSNELFEELIDVNEELMLRKDPEILKILLKDRNTNKNIIWATKSYELLGRGFEENSQIKIPLITGVREGVIRPRVQKLKYEQKLRTKVKAEVFTPVWIVKKQTDLIEKEYEKLSLTEYLSKTMMELTCGEAPYMVNRYDTVTGNPIHISERIGFLDRKLQRICSEFKKHDDWYKAVKVAFQSSFGYEYQGDSLLIARENLLYTFYDYYKLQFNESPSQELKKEIANIISFNVFQMDGIYLTVPCINDNNSKLQQLNLFSYEDTVENKKNVKDIQIKRWDIGKNIYLKTMKGEKDMKFDVIIGNPPYDSSSEGTNRKIPIYNHFMDCSFEIAEKTILITPGRFLFEAGQTKAEWNKKMLNDKHLKVLYYTRDGNKIFPNADIKGGIVITYRDSSKEYIPIKQFIPEKELQNIVKKVNNYPNLTIIHHNRSSYRLNESLYEEWPDLKNKVKHSERTSIPSNIFDKISEVLSTKKINHTDIEIIGLQNKKRTSKFIKAKYITKHPNLDKWKVFVAKSNGEGHFGEPFSTLEVKGPNVIATQTFISLGSFIQESEAQALRKYLKTKFLRTLLSVAKVTPDNARSAVWRFIPNQNFEKNSDIDWTKKIVDIDKQLYKKYNLTNSEIEFIEKNVKEME